MNKYSRIALGFVCASVFFLFSCQQFFTSSLAAPLARDPSSLVPAVTSANAADLAAAVADDPAASLTVLDGLSDVIAAAPAAEQPALAALALDVAANASGVGGALLESTGTIADLLTSGNLSDAATQNQLFDAIDDAIGGLGTNLTNSASALADILTGTSATIDQIAETATADELAMAAIVLLSANAQADSGGVSGYVDHLGTTGSLTASEQLAADLAAAAAAKYAAEGGTGPLANVLAALNLT